MGDRMLVNAKEILKKARYEKYAVPQFNINNLEWVKYILEKCNELESPVILGASEGAIKYMGGYNVVFSLVKSMINDIKIDVPVVLHLDHGSSIESCKKAIDAGFTSVMIDASKYDLEENIRITKEVVEYALIKNVSVEAEVGHIGGTEDDISADIAYAKVEDALKLVKETNIDFLAPALGSVHGPYKGEPKLDFERMNTIKEQSNLPLVLHGGSGIPDHMIKKAIESGIAKININTELQMSWFDALNIYMKKENPSYDPRKVIGSGENAIKQSVEEKVILLGSKGKK
jgi:fructose-1,6-bisphosphate aldolase class II